MAAKKKGALEHNATCVGIDGGTMRMVDEMCEKFFNETGIRPSRAAMFRLAVRKYYESQ